jgi:hypothetical protein
MPGRVEEKEGERGRERERGKRTKRMGRWRLEVHSAQKGRREKERDGKNVIDCSTASRERKGRKDAMRIMRG